MRERTRVWPAEFEYVVWGVREHGPIPTGDRQLRALLVGGGVFVFTLAVYWLITLMAQAVVAAAAARDPDSVSALAGFAEFNWYVFAGLVGVGALAGLTDFLNGTRNREVIRTIEDELLRFEENAYLYGNKNVRLTPEHLDDMLYQLNGFLTESQAYLREKMEELRRRIGWGLWHVSILIGLLFGFAGFIAALSVDYFILQDFWSRQLADEFGDVPPDFRNSVIGKSLQVVVAALVFHFFWKTLKPMGQKIFISIVFAMTVLLLLGLGFFQATATIPSERSVTGISIQGRPLTAPPVEQEDLQDDDLLAELGLEERSQQAETAQPREELPEGAIPLATVETLIWYGSFGFIFIAVTGAAVLSLNFGLRAANAFFGYIDDEGWRAARRNLRNVRLTLAQYRKIMENLGDPRYRKTLFYSALGLYRDHYLKGTLDRLDGKGAKDQSADEAYQEAAASLDPIIEATRTKWTEGFIDELILDADRTATQKALAESRAEDPYADRGNGSVPDHAAMDDAKTNGSGEGRPHG